jgi:transcriptional regulator with XRE-family HTH domain
MEQGRVAMSTTIHDDADRRQRTLAQKLQRLREMRTSRGEQPLSYDATARRITELTGVSISGPYFWELATGRTTNPKLHHLQALARYFHVPVAYLADDSTNFQQLEAELELLHTLKWQGVRSIELQGTTDSSTDLPTIQRLLSKLKLLEGFADDETRETALRLTALPPPQRAALQPVLDDDELLQALQNEHIRQLTRMAAGLTSEQLATATKTIDELDVLNGLRLGIVHELVLAASRLSSESRQVILALIKHLHDVENPHAG